MLLLWGEKNKQLPACRADALALKIPVELSRCATACQGCGAVFIFRKRQ